MLSFECPKCKEKELIEPVQEIIDSLEELTIRCTVCGYEGKPEFYRSNCNGTKQ